MIVKSLKFILILFFKQLFVGIHTDLLYW